MRYRALIKGSCMNTTGELAMGGKTLDSEEGFRYLSQSSYFGDVGLAGRYTRGYRSATDSTFDPLRPGCTRPG